MGRLINASAVMAKHRPHRSQWISQRAPLTTLRRRRPVKAAILRNLIQRLGLKTAKKRACLAVEAVLELIAPRQPSRLTESGVPQPGRCSATRALDSARRPPRRVPLAVSLRP